MNSIQKDYNSWNTSKQRLNNKNGDVFFYEREIWWCSIGVNIGHESDGKHSYFERPVLILKIVGKELFWGIPLTSSIKINRFHAQIWVNDNLSSAMITQMRIFSSKRLLRKMGSIDKHDYLVVKTSILNILG